MTLRKRLARTVTALAYAGLDVAHALRGGWEEALAARVATGLVGEMMSAGPEQVRGVPESEHPPGWQSRPMAVSLEPRGPLERQLHTLWSKPTSCHGCHDKRWWRAQQAIAAAADRGVLVLAEEEQEALVAGWRAVVDAPPEPAERQNDAPDDKPTTKAAWDVAWAAEAELEELRKQLHRVKRERDNLLEISAELKLLREQLAQAKLERDKAISESAGWKADAEKHYRAWEERGEQIADLDSLLTKARADAGKWKEMAETSSRAHQNVERAALESERRLRGTIEHLQAADQTRTEDLRDLVGGDGDWYECLKTLKRALEAVGVKTVQDILATTDDKGPTPKAGWVLLAVQRGQELHDCSTALEALEKELAEARTERDEARATAELIGEELHAVVGDYKDPLVYGGWDADLAVIREILDKLGAETVCDVRRGIKGAERLTQQRATSPESQDSNPDQDEQHSQLLDDPRMDGETWIPAPEVTQAMLDAWPVWESFTDGMKRPRQDLAHDLCAGRGAPYRRRPLRLPGMDERGVIAAKDMTEAHFARVEVWEYTNRYDPEWSGREKWSGRDIGRWEWMDVVQEDDTEFWRPVVLAEGKAKENNVDLDALYRLLGVDSLKAAVLAVRGLHRLATAWETACYDADAWRSQGMEPHKSLGKARQMSARPLVELGRDQPTP